MWLFKKKLRYLHLQNANHLVLPFATSFGYFKLIIKINHKSKLLFQ